MKKTNTMTSDYSKSSFFNDGNNLFCNSPFGLLKFNGYGTFIMKYQNRQFQVSIFLANSWLKIVDEKGEKYVNLENVCFKKSLHPKTQQLGFRLSRNGQYVEFFGELIDIWKQIKKYVIQADFAIKYKLGQKIGAGYCSSVFKTYKTLSGESYAVKIIEKCWLARNNNREKVELLNELNILRKISHKNIVKLEETFENEENIFIVTEFLEGGHLKNAIFKFRFTESETITLMQSLFQALNYLHSNNIYHQDIKFDNILLRDQQDLTSACIINLGKSEQITESGLSLTSLNLNCNNENALLSFYRRKDIYSLSIVVYSVFAKKQFQELQLLDELMMKNYDNMNDLKYMDLSPQLKEFFDLLFSHKGKYQIETITCEEILEFEVFKQNKFKRSSKVVQALQLNMYNDKRSSIKLFHRPSQRGQLIQQQNLDKSLKLPQINESYDTKNVGNLSQSPKTENTISCRFLTDLSTNPHKIRYSLLKKCLSPNI